MNLKKIIAMVVTGTIAIAVAAMYLNRPPVTTPKKQDLVVYNYKHLSPKTQRQIDCLAKNMYFEANGEPQDGQIAVAMVTLNRVNSGKFPDSVCGVVYQKTRKTYQFSWVGMKKKLTKVNIPVYNDIVQLATTVYMNHEKIDDITDGAEFYHATYVSPQWKGLVKTNQIGRHIFYRQDI